MKSNPTRNRDFAASAEIGFLVVGHGTRSPAGQRQLREVFNDYAQLLSDSACELCFLELAKPDISTAVAKLASKGVKHLITVPVLLFSAGHAKSDIPQAVAHVARQSGIQRVAQCPTLGCASSVLELSALRFREAVCRVGNTICCGEGCSGIFCPTTGLAMIGRGSQDAAAAQAMRDFTQLRCQLTPVFWHTTGFIYGQSPSVSQALDELEQTECQVAVVQPHLLFEGQLIEDLRVQVAQRQQDNPEKNWLITESLGADHRLSEVLFRFSIAAVHQDAENEQLFT